MVGGELITNCNTTYEYGALLHILTRAAVVELGDLQLVRVRLPDPVRVQLQEGPESEQHVQTELGLQHHQVFVLHQQRHQV